MALVDSIKKKRSTFAESAVEQIPTDGYPSAPVGESASGSELGRNVSNTLAALPGATGLRLGGLASRAVAPSVARLAGPATPAAQPAAWELVNEGGQLAAQVGRAAPQVATALPSVGGQLARAATDLTKRVDPRFYSQPELGMAANATPALAAPAGPLSRAAALVPTGVQQAPGALASTAPVAATAGGVGAALIGAETSGTPANNPFQNAEFGTASLPVNAGAGRGNVNTADASTLAASTTFGAQPGRGTANDPRRLDMNPARASLGAARDFTPELNQVPRNLPADLRPGVVVKTVDPATGRVTYSGRNVSQDASGQTQMVDGVGRDLAPLGQPRGNFAQAVDAAGRPTSFAAPGMDGAVSLDGRQQVNSGAGRLAAAATASPFPGISAQNNMAAENLAARNDGSLEARALANKAQYDQEVAGAQAFNRQQYERANPLTRNQVAARQIEATTAANAAGEAGANARALLKETGDTARANILAGAKADGTTPQGYRRTAAGNLEAIPGGPADLKAQANADKPLNDVQSKALQFGSRMQNSSKILDTLFTQGVDKPGLVKRAADVVGLGSLANGTQSDGQQQVEQAQRDFVNAVLRRESGAAIADSEFANAKQQYFPQIGDSAKVIEQKRKNRDIATQGVLAEVPQAESRVAKVTAAAASTTAPRTPTRTGTLNGRKVVQYSDGSTEYAN